jgi:sodium/potassium-transporting ATPase subunit alpha
LAKDVKITEHLLSINELCSKLQTNLETGLSESEAAFRLKRDGLNAFTPPKQTPKWLLFVREMTAGFASLLWFAAIASCIAYAIERVPQDVSKKTFSNLQKCINKVLFFLFINPTYYCYCSII